MPNTDAVTVTECQTPADRLAYIHFQWEIYKGGPDWVPTLISERVALWGKRQNPFI